LGQCGASTKYQWPLGLYLATSKLDYPMHPQLGWCYDSFHLHALNPMAGKKIQRADRSVVMWQIGARSDVNTSEQDLAHDRLSSIGKEILVEPSKVSFLNTTKCLTSDLTQQGEASGE